MEILQKLRNAGRIARAHGLPGIRGRLRAQKRVRREKAAFREWIAANAPTAETRAAVRARIAAFARRPRLSVVMPVYNVEEKWLRRCIDSVFAQLYENWELCLADDCSPSPHVRRVLEEYAARDRRVKVVFRERNGHISAASNSALELATGEFCVLLDHDDELTEDALFCVAAELEAHPDTAFIYSDEDMIDEHGVRFIPKFKPDFSRDLFYSLNLITHLSAYRTELLRAIGGFRLGVEGSQDYDLALRFIERIDERQIRHIPRILYHWRAIRGSVALSSDEKPYAHERARRALQDHFDRLGTAARVERGAYEFHRVRYALPAVRPRGSLILHGADAADAAAAEARARAQTVYENVEIVVADAANGGAARAARLNAAAAAARGEILCFLDARLVPRGDEWLGELVGFVLQEKIGAAGGKIYDRHGGIAEAGLIVGFDGAAGAAHRGFAADDAGYLIRLKVVNNFSALSARCLAVRREVFETLGGFDAERLPNALFDADFCLRLGAAGRRCVFTPYAEFDETRAAANANAPTAAENDFFRRKWAAVIARDPFYNPHLAVAGETFAIRAERVID